MEFESLRDQKGKEHLVFNASEFNEEESIGDKKMILSFFNYWVKVHLVKFLKFLL